MNSLTVHSLLQYFDLPTLKQAVHYANATHVQLVCAYDRDSGRLLVIGHVDGTNRYTAKIFLNQSGTSILQTSCTCRRMRDCKHAAAVAAVFARGAMNTSTEDKSAEAHSHMSDDEETPTHRIDYPPAIKRTPDIRIPTDIYESLRSIAERIEPKPQTAFTVEDVDAWQTHMPQKSAILYVLAPRHMAPSTSCHIEARTVNVRRNGSFGASKPLDIQKFIAYPQMQSSNIAPIDMKIIELWNSALDNTLSDWEWSSPDMQNNFRDAQSLHSLLELMMQSRRCRFSSTNGLRLHWGKPLPGKLIWVHKNGQYKIQVAIEDDNQSTVCLQWKTPLYIQTETGTCGAINVPLPIEALDQLLSLRSLQPGELQSVPFMLASIDLQNVVPVPPDCKAVAIDIKIAAPRLTAAQLRSKHLLYDGETTLAVPGQTIRVACIAVPQVDSTPKYQRADADTIFLEKWATESTESILGELRKFGFKYVSADALEGANNDNKHLIADATAWLSLNSNILKELRQKGWHISDETEHELLPLRLREEDIEFHALIGEDADWWVSLALNLEVDGGHVPLIPILLNTIRGFSPTEDIISAIDRLNVDGLFVTALENGRTITLPFDRVRSILIAFRELAFRSEDAVGGYINVSKMQVAALWQNKLLHNATWNCSAQLIEFVERLRQLSQLQPVDPPREFKANLRNYQREGLAWLQFLAEQNLGGILADDMGLGKTVQVLAHVALEKPKLRSPFLVVCPTSVLHNWVSESSRFVPHLTVVTYYGSNRLFLLGRLATADLVITTYPVLTRDIENLKTFNWHGIVLDEAQAIKTPNTFAALAVQKLQAGHRFCLTGTPIENHLGELWSLMQFLLPGFLGHPKSFNKCIRVPIEKHGDLAIKTSFQSRMKPFILRRTKQDVAKELPEKTVIIQRIELHGTQRDLYETTRAAYLQKVRDAIAERGFNRSQIMILEALLRLRQACCDPRLMKLSGTEKFESSAKLEHVLDMLQQLSQQGRKILVFSQFTGMLDLIADRLETLNLQFVQLRGNTIDRKAPVECFQNGLVPIFLISLKAGGTGLNLTAADVVIHYDPWWNPAVEDQATDRAHRIGQNKNVFVYKLIAQGTIEERMLELQERKRVLANCIYDDRGNMNAPFTESDLEVLLRPMR